MKLLIELSEEDYDDTIRLLDSQSRWYYASATASKGKRNNELADKQFHYANLINKLVLHLRKGRAKLEEYKLEISIK